MLLTLKELCLNKIINDNSINFNSKKLPTVLIDAVKIATIEKECGNIVTTTLDQEYENVTWAECFKCPSKVSSSLYDKRCVTSNIKIFLQHFDDSRFYHFLPKREYILYYLKQDSDYNKIYKRAYYFKSGTSKQK